MRIIDIGPLSVILNQTKLKNNAESLYTLKTLRHVRSNVVEEDVFGLFYTLHKIDTWPIAFY